LQTEMIGHGLKVSVVLQELMPVLDTVSADDEVGGFTHSLPDAAKFSIIGSGSHGKFWCQHRYEPKAF